MTANSEIYQAINLSIYKFDPTHICYITLKTIYTLYTIYYIYLFIFSLICYVDLIYIYTPFEYL